MPDLPSDPLHRIDSMLEMISIAHATIFTWRRLLIDLGHDEADGREQLAESVEIVFSYAPDATREARALVERWGEQELLDPDSAPATRLLLDQAIKEAEAHLAHLLARQEQIAGELQRLTEEPPDLPGEA